MFKAIVVIVAMTLLGHCSNLNAQAPRKVSVSKSTVVESQKPNAEFTGPDVYWPSIAGHSVAVLQVSGPGLNKSQTFKDGEAPFFRPLLEGMESEAIYNFRIEYQPDELVRLREQFRKARKERNRELALKLLDEIQHGNHKHPFASGSFLMDADGNVKTYNLKSTLKDLSLIHISEPTRPY